MSDPESKIESRPKPSRKRRTGNQAKVALAVVETHLSNVQIQFEALKKAIAELKAQLS